MFYINHYILNITKNDHDQWTNECIFYNVILISTLNIKDLKYVRYI